MTTPTTILTLNQKPDDPRAIADEWLSMEKMWGDALTAMALADSYYTQDYDIWGTYNEGRDESAKRPQYHSPMDTALIKNAVNAHLAYHPTYHRNPTGDGEAAKEAATRVEKSLTALVVDAFNSQSGSQPGIPPKVNGTQMMLHNHTSLFTGWDFDALREPERNEGEDAEDFERRHWEWESRHLTWNPIRIEVPAPGEVLFNSTDARPTVAIRKRKLRAHQLADWTMRVSQRGAGKIWDMGRHDPYEEIEFYERWTARWVAVYLDHKGTGKKDVLTVQDNTYWMQPFIQTWGGDIVAIAGKDFNIEQWVRQAMIFRAMDTLRFTNQNITSKHNVLIDRSWAKDVYNGDPAELAEQLEGDIVGVDPARWTKEPAIEVPNAMFQESEELRRHLELGTYSAQAAGFKESGVRTATEAMSLAQAVSRVFLGTVNRLEMLYSTAGSNALWLFYRLTKEYNVEGKISIGRETLKLKDLGEPPKFGGVFARFEQVDAAVREALRQSLLVELERGVIDLETYHKEIGRENTTEILKGIIRDRVLQMPEIMAEQEITALIEMGYEEIADRKKEEAQMRRAQTGPFPPANGQAPVAPGRNGNGMG